MPLSMSRRSAAMAMSALAFTGAVTGCSAVNKARDAAKAVNALGKLPKDVEDLDAKIQAAQKLTYKAEYSSAKTGDSTVTSLRVSQKPPNFKWEQGEATFFQDAQFFYNCSKGLAGDQRQVACLKTPAPSDGTSANGFAFGLNVVSILATVRILAIIPGVTVTKGNRDEAGQHLDCVAIRSTRDKQDQTLEECTTADGILGYFDDGSGSVFKLSSFSKDVSDGDFRLPGKAFTQEELQAEQLRQAATTTTEPTTTTAEETTTTSEEATTTTTTEETTTTTEDTTTTSSP